MSNLKYFGLIGFGLVIGLVILEICLAVIPEETFDLLVSRRPVRYQLYQLDPQIGWRLKPNTQYHYRQENEYDVPLRINSQGLNDVEHSYEKPPGVFRILILGDSFTEAAQVPVPANFARLLEGCLQPQQPVEVINGGVSYYSSAEELFFLQHEGYRYQPDLILVAFYVGNDIEAYDAYRRTDDGWLDALGGYLTGLDEAGRLQKTWLDWKNPGPASQVSAVQLFLRRHSRLYRLLTHSDSKVADWLQEQRETFAETGLGQWLEQWPGLAQAEAAQPAFDEDIRLMIYAPNFPDGPGLPPSLVDAWAIIQAIFEQFQAMANSMDAQLGVLIIPAREQAHQAYYYEAYQDYARQYGPAIAGIEWNYAAPNQALARFLSQKNIPYLDLLPPFRAYDEANGPALYFETDRHFNPAGHRLTAELLCSWIEKKHFIKPVISDR